MIVYQREGCGHKDLCVSLWCCLHAKHTLCIQLSCVGPMYRWLQRHFKDGNLLFISKTFDKMIVCTQVMNMCYSNIGG